MVLFSDMLYTESTVVNGVTLLEGYYFKSDGTVQYYLSNGDPAMDVWNEWGTWTRDGNNITVTTEDGWSETGSFTEFEERTDGLTAVTAITIYDRVFTDVT